MVATKTVFFQIALIGLLWGLVSCQAQESSSGVDFLAEADPLAAYSDEERFIAFEAVNDVLSGRRSVASLAQKGPAARVVLRQRLQEQIKQLSSFSLTVGSDEQARIKKHCVDAARWFGQSRDQEAIDFLIAILPVTQSPVVPQALRQITNQDFGSNSMQWWRWRQLNRSQSTKVKALAAQEVEAFRKCSPAQKVVALKQYIALVQETQVTSSREKTAGHSARVKRGQFIDPRRELARDMALALFMEAWDDPEPSVHQTSQAFIAECGLRSLPFLIKKSRSSKASERFKAVRVMERFQAIETRDALRALLNDPTLDVRVAAIRALGPVADPRDWQSLKSRLLQKPASEERIVIEGALALGHQDQHFESLLSQANLSLLKNGLSFQRSRSSDRALAELERMVRLVFRWHMNKQASQMLKQAGQQHVNEQTLFMAFIKPWNLGSSRSSWRRFYADTASLCQQHFKSLDLRAPQPS